LDPAMLLGFFVILDVYYRYYHSTDGQDSKHALYSQITGIESKYLEMPQNGKHGHYF